MHWPSKSYYPWDLKQENSNHNDIDVVLLNIVVVLYLRNSDYDRDLKYLVICKKFVL